MKCPKCGTEMEWMGDVTILIKDTDKYLYKLSKKAFQSKNIEIWGVYCKNCADELRIQSAIDGRK